MDYSCFNQLHQETTVFILAADIIHNPIISLADPLLFVERMVVMFNGINIVLSDVAHILSHHAPLSDALGDPGSASPVYQLLIQAIASFLRNGGQESVQSYHCPL